MEIILYNSVGQEISRAFANSDNDIKEIIASWVITPGDHIYFEQA